MDKTSIRVLRGVSILGRKVKRGISDCSYGAINWVHDRSVLTEVEHWTESVPTSYDLAMDSVYNTTNEWGNLHRLFDGNHDPYGSWQAAKDALPDDTWFEEVSGWLDATMKDAGTQNGVPYVTVSEARYEELCTLLPGVPRRWVFDLLNTDLPEMAGTIFSAILFFLLLRRGKYREASKAVGALVVIGVVTANAVLVLVGVSAGIFLLLQHRMDWRALGLGISLAGIPLLLAWYFSISGFWVVLLFIAVAGLSRLKATDAVKIRALKFWSWTKSLEFRLFQEWDDFFTPNGCCE